jgi:hypothetical protein
MSNSRNDYRRNKFSTYDDEANGQLKAIKEKYSHRYEKKLNNALRKKSIEELYEDDQDY